MKTRKLYDPRGESWMKGFTQPADSHRLYADWVEDRWSWTEDGVPMKLEKEATTADWDVTSAPSPHEVQRVSGIDGDEIVGPVEFLRGKRVSQAQVFCGDFDFEETISADFHRLLAKQARFSDRLLQMKIDASQQAEYDRRVKNKRRREKWREDRVVKKNAACESADDRRARREKMRKKMQTAGYSAEQFARGLLVKVQSKNMKMKETRRIRRKRATRLEVQES